MLDSAIERVVREREQRAVERDGGAGVADLALDVDESRAGDGTEAGAIGSTYRYQRSQTSGSLLDPAVDRAPRRGPCLNGERRPLRRPPSRVVATQRERHDGETKDRHERSSPKAAGKAPQRKAARDGCSWSVSVSDDRAETQSPEREPHARDAAAHGLA
jgi:hypothetical protein